VLIHDPVTLEGEYVRLEPLSLEHHAALSEVGLDPEIWRWTTVHVRTPEGLRMYIEDAITLQKQGSALPFAIIWKEGDTVIGSSRYMNIDAPNRRVEIGATWVAPAWQRTAANTEAKLLMMAHAFETLGCIRVEFKTDSLNEKSRRALAGIGATEEGTFRHHMIVPSMPPTPARADGTRLRDSVYFSVIAEEWPSVKAGLIDRLARHSNPSHASA
jgi:RimJ/RimL family protein N-acetyltransferase